jgi:glycosyltransferase involved in cell wall biosynthesis
MTRVIHLIDKNTTQDVTRFLLGLTENMRDGSTHRVHVADPARVMAPALDADIVVVHFAVSRATLLFLIALRARIGAARLVIVEHTYTRSYERLAVRNRYAFHSMLRLSYLTADKVVAVSQAQAGWLSKIGVVSDSKLLAIAPALDVSCLKAVPMVRPGRGAPLRLAAYGHFSVGAGFDVLVEAMRFVAPAEASLELRGEGPDEAALRARAAELPHVTIDGPAGDLPAFLGKADAVAIPSRWDGFGAAAQEARAAGRPVVATMTDGLAEQIDPACGVLCLTENPVAMAVAIQSLCSRNLPAMGEAARTSVAGMFRDSLGAWSSLLRELGPLAERRVPVRVLVNGPWTMPDRSAI